MALAFIATCVVSPVAAEVYECRGNDGKPVLTNRPKGLRGCIRLETMTPPGTSNPPPVLHDVEPAQVDPLAVPLPMPPHGMMPDPPPPPGPDTPPPNEQAGYESHCRPQINPLSPLSGQGCPPPAETTTPEPPPGN